MTTCKTLRPLITFLLILVFSLTASINAEQKARPMKLAKATEAKLKYKDISFTKPFRCAYRPFATPIVNDSFTAFGLVIRTVKVDEKTLNVTWMEKQEPIVVKKSGTIVDITSGDTVFPLCFYRDPVTGEWKYFNGIYKEAKALNGTIRFFDMNCNGKWFEPKIDAVMYGNSAFVSPIMPVQWYFDWRISDFEFIIVKKKPKLKIKFDPIKCYPDERKAMTVLNKFRMDMGLPALPLGEELSRKCRLYAKFISLQGGDMADWNNVQNPAEGMIGFTPECLEMKNSMFFCFDDCIVAMEDMIGQFYHRTQFFLPTTKEFGIGAYGAVTVFNGEMTVDPEYMKWKYPIVIPAPEQTIRYYVYYGKYGGETPDPRPAGGSGTFPITVQWDRGEHNIDVKAFRLLIVKGKKEEEVESYCFWPKRPANPSRPDNEMMILLMGSRPFKRGARYHVIIEYTIDDKDNKLDWYFSTAKK